MYGSGKKNGMHGQFCCFWFAGRKIFAEKTTNSIICSLVQMIFARFSYKDSSFHLNLAKMAAMDNSWSWLTEIFIKKKKKHSTLKLQKYKCFVTWYNLCWSGLLQIFVILSWLCKNCFQIIIHLWNYLQTSLVIQASVL